MRAALTQQETVVSYWRRILQARVDLLSTGGSVAGLSEVLADVPSAHRRLAHLTVDIDGGSAPLPDLLTLWTRVADPENPAAVAQLAEDLRAAEGRVSALRRELFDQIDAVTAELIARLQANPHLALTCLPQR